MNISEQLKNSHGVEKQKKLFRAIMRYIMFKVNEGCRLTTIT